MPSALGKAPTPDYMYGGYVIGFKEKMNKISREVKDRIVATKEKNKEYYDMKAREQDYEIGEIVNIKVEALKKGQTSKLTPKFDGPWEIKEKISDSEYKIQKKKVKLAHRDKIRRAFQRVLLQNLEKLKISKH